MCMNDRTLLLNDALVYVVGIVNTNFLQTIYRFCEFSNALNCQEVDLLSFALRKAIVLCERSIFRLLLANGSKLRSIDSSRIFCSDNCGLLLRRAKISIPAIMFLINRIISVLCMGVRNITFAKKRGSTLLKFNTFFLLSLIFIIIRI